MTTTTPTTSSSSSVNNTHNNNNNINSNNCGSGSGNGGICSGGMNCGNSTGAVTRIRRIPTNLSDDELDSSVSVFFGF